jgi:hypothetical protein
MEKNRDGETGECRNSEWERKRVEEVERNKDGKREIKVDIGMERKR